MRVRKKFEVSQSLFADDILLVMDSKKKLERLVVKFGRFVGEEN